MPLPSQACRASGEVHWPTRTRPRGAWRGGTFHRWCARSATTRPGRRGTVDRRRTRVVGFRRASRGDRAVRHVERLMTPRPRLRCRCLFSGSRPKGSSSVATGRREAVRRVRPRRRPALPGVRRGTPRDQLHGRLVAARSGVRVTAPDRAICARCGSPAAALGYRYIRAMCLGTVRTVRGVQT